MTRPLDPDEHTTTLRITERGNSRMHRVSAVWNGGSFTTELTASGTVDIGRAGECLVCIDHPSISRRHARLTLGATVLVEDLGSSNGTWANGKRLSIGEATTLQPGSVLEVGSVLVVIQTAEQSEEAEAAATPPLSTSGMPRVLQLVNIVARSAINVVLLGETGSGKGFFARRIHALSPRAAMPLVELNCAALTESLLESELFGYERGAFTGAAAPKAGLLEMADGGTAFLDEIGEMPLSMQPKLLRVFESGEVTRVGGTRSRKIDVRYVTATNRDLGALIANGQFREDLFFRIDGFSITIPPLRTRLEEVGPLADQFLEEAHRELATRPVRFSNEALARLTRHAWPGNIRELRNVVRRSALLSTSDTVSAEDLQFADPSARGVRSSSSPPGDVGGESGNPERDRIVAALEQCAGNQTRAAKLLGVSRRTLVNRIEAFGVPRPKKG